MKNMRSTAWFTAFMIVFGWMAMGEAKAAEHPVVIKRIMDETTITPEGCIIENFRIISPSMGREIKAMVVLPHEYKAHPEKKYPVLYTLHGAKSPIDRYITKTPVLLQTLKDKPMIVTCMDVDGFSWFLDSPYPQDPSKSKEPLPKVKSLFTTFFFDEIIPCVDQNYRINPKQRMLTGNSMGGFGAFHYMLTKPEMFLSVSALSGLYEKTDADQAERKWEPLLGSIQEFPERHRSVDVFEHVKSVARKGAKFPQLYMICGTEDALLPHNRAMQSLLKELGVPFEYHEFPGKHGWPFWSEHLSEVIDFHWKSVQQQENVAKINSK